MWPLLCLDKLHNLAFLLPLFSPTAHLPLLSSIPLSSLLPFISTPHTRSFALLHSLSPSACLYLELPEAAGDSLQEQRD